MGRTSAWTGLFGSRSPKRKPDPKIRWFGKLPTYADYYSSKTDEDWVVEFNEWLLEGFGKYVNSCREGQNADDSREHPSGIRRLPNSAGAIRLPKSGMTVFASMQDYGGDMVGRPFPLCLYVAVPTSRWPGPTSDRLGGASRAIEDLTRLHRDVVRFFNSPGGFRAVFDGREADLTGIGDDASDQSWAQVAAGISMTEWYNVAGRELKAESLGAWLDRVARWGDKIAGLESDGFKPTLSFPLAHGINLHAQVAGWVRWLELRMDLKRRALSLLVTTGSGDDGRRLVIMDHDLSPEDFLLLTPLWSRLRYVDDLSKEEAGESRAAVPSDSGDGGTGLNESWAGFVQARPRRA